ncbi:thiol:disulfide interchange protein [Subsaximicrobium wynnwilliamsii]|uniref:Thiol:disulfide interchange protein n=1 Tax=Subsaximicrobium wynnwilliamsii TaxID=291179 RepID=A0A5C6ZLI5_9FLAO|nr:thioredoxin family protein [Subsaximicrobium wynnwilliamsii]TXD84400.1 thiol:disulfide interchange protein [Subsaximicrobium wynnwilliamsii]TXD90081.1 thiol:disulfide interchange protein [Subsaximicrobium wynnwilliamsii]TXE04133.1 thiol:disulfide interchange protein [Subsaximicrobium wynnwilliamsii]
MKYVILLLIGCYLGITNVSAQILEPVKWTTSIEKVSETEYDLIATSKIDAGWHLYSQNVPEGGPIPTTFTFETNADFELLGKVVEEEGRTINDPVFNMRIKFFENSAQFRQRIKVLNEELSIVKGEVEFMVCDDTRCLPPTYIDLNFNLDGSNSNLTSSENASEGNSAVDFQNPEKSEAAAQSEKATVANETKAEGEVQEGLWTIFILGLGAGLIALFTPCVFPLIPMTVSFFTKQSKNKAQGIKNAFIYGLCIIVIYVILGTGVVAIFGASAINEFSTSVTFNLLFFIILVIFAVSFLGAFEIMLPNSWANKIDSKADKGGFTGIFFMALALAIVSFSCTGPFVGNIIVLSATKGGLAPMIGMLGFSIALALPFGLFAAFPGWLNSLPKSGGWLNTVKVVLGFLELAFAFKFLSQADLVLQLHFLEREVFIAIWIAIFGALAFYLFGKIKLPHDSPLTHISVGRLSLGLLVLSFTIYMIPGLWGAPLNLISAFPPPLDYAESPYGVGNSKTSGSFISNDNKELPEGAHLLAPHQILAFNDYDKGMAYAKKVNKPVMLDFTGWACVNCRKMEQNVWPEDQVLNVLKNDVILISLYVDDKRKLPENEVVASKLRPGKQLKYIGQKWSEFQAIKFKTNTQPYYALLDTDGKVLNKPVGYTPDVEEYLTWMQEGVEAFEE